MGPHQFMSILQHGDPFKGAACRGFVTGLESVPTRVVFLSDSANPAAGWRARLFDAVAAELATTSVAASKCNGPADLDCWATRNPSVAHRVVYVAGDGPPTPAVVASIDEYVALGAEVMCVIPSTENPDVVLPPRLRRTNGATWDLDVLECQSDVLDLLMESEIRRVFISYSHADPEPTAARLANLMTWRGFDVFLDRFSLPPSVDFIERIEDELFDKAMVVVVESIGAAGSSWVRQEVAIAEARGLGVAAVNIGDQPRIASIDETRRCRIDDDDVLVDFIEHQHRIQLATRRASLRRSVLEALIHAGVVRGDIVATRDGFHVQRTSSSMRIDVLPRPAQLGGIRRLAERASGGRAALVHQPPPRPDRRRNLQWLTDLADVFEVAEGSIVAGIDELWNAG